MWIRETANVGLEATGDGSKAADDDSYSVGDDNSVEKSFYPIEILFRLILYHFLIDVPSFLL